MTIFMWRCTSVLLIVVAAAILLVTGLRPPETSEGWRCLTRTFICLWMLQLFVFDVLARVAGGNEATVSAVLLDASKAWPIIPIIFGILIGHIWWSVR